MMKNLFLLLCIVTPITVFAHPGHGVDEQAHGLLHVEHLLTLVAIVAVVLFAKAIKK